MRYWVGFDVGKAFHWVCVLDDEGEEVLSRKVEADEEDLEAACSEIERLDGERTVGIDLLSGLATLLEAVLLGRGERVFHVPGIAVNRARDAYPGEAKSDSKDAHVIADQLRLRRGSLHEVCPKDEITAEMRLLVAHRRDLLQDQTRRAARLREVLLGVFPGLEAALVAELASEILRTRERIADLDRRLEELLTENPAAHIVRTLPGMGVVFTAEFIADVGNLGRFASADALAAAAGVAPVLRASGATSYRRRARRGNKVLKRVLYRSAVSCISHHERSEAFYRKKRAEGKGHHQAVIALARRRVDVLWAMLRDGQMYSERPSQAA